MQINYHPQTQTLAHITLNTGHRVDSPRIRNQFVLNSLRTHLDTALEAPLQAIPIPNLSGYSVQVEVLGDTLIVAVYAGGAPIEKDRLLVFGVAARDSTSADDLWSAMLQRSSVALPVEIPFPWCIVGIERDDGPVMARIASYERCLSWAWYERIVCGPVPVDG